MRIVFRAAGVLTLLLDAYVLLSLVAIGRMNRQYHEWLPPFGNDLAASIPPSVYIGLVLWTGFLALGCLVVTRAQVPSR